jgi:hypothetical protein
VSGPADAALNLERRAYANESNLVELLLDVSDEITLGLFDNPNKASLGQRLGRNVLSANVGRVFEVNGAHYRIVKQLKNGVNEYRLEPQHGADEVRSAKR